MPKGTVTQIDKLVSNADFDVQRDPVTIGQVGLKCTKTEDDGRKTMEDDLYKSRSYEDKSLSFFIAYLDSTCHVRDFKTNLYFSHTNLEKT